MSIAKTPIQKTARESGHLFWEGTFVRPQATESLPPMNLRGKSREHAEVRKMRRLWLLPLIVTPFLVARSDEGVPEGFQQWTPSSLKALVQTLASEAASDPHQFAVKQLADFPNESFLLVHREADGQVEWHETQIDIFLVQSGSATLVVGGTYLHGETVAPHEKRNGTIQGGIRRKLAPGDVIRIPAGVPHQLLLEGSHEFTYLVVKGKGY